MKPVKMDYVIWSKYKYEDKGNKIPCDVTVMYSSKDPLSASVHGWADLTEKNIDFYELGDNHFFIKQHYKEVAEIINNHLRKYI